MSSTAGLKEFADGDAALFNVLNLESQEDFETEFRRLLTENIPNPDFTPFSDSPTITEQVKFEEDPLSTILNNTQQQATPPMSKTSKKKRGRPPNLKFKYNFVNEPKIHKQTPPQTQMIQQVQMRDRRSEDDKYSPVWIRGRGVDREGLCPLCQHPPVWLKIKQSAYWYHMNFYHGISAATGRPYKLPINYRLSEAKRVEGHCATCLKWIVLSTDFDGASIQEFDNFTSWYKHAQKCHYRTKEFQKPNYFN